MKNVEVLEEPKGILHLFRGNHFVEVHQASQESADVAHVCHDNPSMETSFSQIGPVQVYKVANVVCDEYAAGFNAVLQKRGIRPPLLTQVVHALGIDASCT